ncbi:MAG: DUF2169 domain-containing protein [Rhodanobacteraceae bacterium]|nr:DUF2169 domain-containing protein [Rhodanobacteraceae bacterium]
MHIVNGTRHLLDATQAMDKAGRRYLVAIAKATFDFPEAPGGELSLAKDQMPILGADVFDGEAGLSTPLFECDYVTVKARCDVTLRASACAPGGEAVRELDVAFRVAGCEKWARIVGDRTWQLGLLGLTPSEPEPFTSMPITYGRAFGGSCEVHGRVEAHLHNPVGRGYAGAHNNAPLRGQPLPNVEQPGVPVTRSDDSHRPWSFGPIGRSWQPRVEFAGTYDEQWQEDIFPLLPADFDDRFFQSAPSDQQIPFPIGGEDVRLLNLHSRYPQMYFQLPPLDLPMVVLGFDRRVHKLEPVVDSVIVDAEAERLVVVWRAQHPLQRNLREIELLAAGSVCKRWWRSRVLGTPDCGCGGYEVDDDDLSPVNRPLDPWEPA